MIKNKRKILTKTKSRKVSSATWLRRQINDRYVNEAKVLGYKSRAAFKLKEIDEKYAIFKGRSSIVDLGCAPGSWLQVIHENRPKAKIVGVDLKEVKNESGTHFIQGDFTEEKIQQEILDYLGSDTIDLVVSDMAPNTCGIPDIDHSRIAELAQNAAIFSSKHLKKGGIFVCKMFHGKEEKDIASLFRSHFSKVMFFKPKSSRNESTEIFLISIK